MNLPWAATTLIGIEWNTLTYAGHTVWNVHNENTGGKYNGAPKRRPRAEWIINRNTHEPLISDQSAETILAHLENSNVGAAISRAKRGLYGYLLTGVLVTPDGRKWEGQQGRAYRLKKQNGIPGKWLPAAEIDRAVMDKIAADMQSERFVRQLRRDAQKNAAIEDPAKDQRREIVEVNRNISRAMDLALKLEDPAPAIRKTDELERERKRIAAEIARLETEYTARAALRNITEDQIRRLLVDRAADIAGADTTTLKTIVQTVVDQVVLNPETLECVIQYKIALDDSLNVASPGGFEPPLPP